MANQSGSVPIKTCLTWSKEFEVGPNLQQVFISQNGLDSGLQEIPRLPRREILGIDLIIYPRFSLIFNPIDSWKRAETLVNVEGPQSQQ